MFKQGIKMLTFRQYLLELANSPRRSIQHLYQLSPIKFFDLMLIMKDEFKGVLSKENAKITEKIDGTGIRFGLTENNEFFIETSTSGIITKSGQYTEFIKAKGYKPNQITQAIENIFKLLKNYQPLQKFLLKWVKPHIGIKIFAEILYSELGQDLGDKMQFVGIQYDKKYLGKLATIAYIKAIYGDNTNIPNENDLKHDFEKLTTPEIKFITTDIPIDKLDLTVEINNWFKLLNNYGDVQTIQRILKSRKKADKPLKQAIIDLLTQFKQQLQDKIAQQVMKQPKLGEQMEGVVVQLANGISFKIVNDYFKKQKANNPLFQKGS